MGFLVYLYQAAVFLTGRFGKNCIVVIVALAFVRMKSSGGVEIMFKNIRKLPVGIQTFSEIIEDGYLYVDKTEYIYRLASTGKPYFLSRPRRFGKSLFLSTLEAFWLGRKELFKGLRIERQMEESGTEWESHPVFYFDFNKKSYRDPEDLEAILDDHLRGWEDIYGTEFRHLPLEERFQHLLVKAWEQTGKRCVVLVDEYDKPLLETTENKELIEHNKAVFKGFFSTLKSYDRYLRFVFLTGVTKFSKVSIFSDLNQLADISMTSRFADICGITENEMKAVFMPEIRAMAESQGMTEGECLGMLRQTYDGYHFYQDSEGVYNPYSLLNAFADGDFRYYWFSTGTPTFLVDKLKSNRFDVRRFTNRTIYADESTIMDYRSDNPDPVPLLYQTGYLTITDFDRKRRRYVLGFPNEEVKYGFLKSLMPAYVGNVGGGSGKDIFTLTDYVENGDLDGIRDVLTALFAGIPYTTNDAPFEHYFQTVIYIAFTLLGQFVQCEMHTARGRVDCVLETEGYVYIFEFKRDGSADEALEQIEEQRYAEPYAADQRTLYRVGVNFDSETRMLEEWKVK